MEPTDKLNFSDSILRRVAKTIQLEQLIKAEDSVLAAVSGGPDSVALLHILNELHPLMFRKLGVTHLNHCIRPFESDRDAQFVSNLCSKLGLPFYIKQIDVRRYAHENTFSLEEAGRICRYDFFKSLAQTEGYTKIALGHHADDNAELVLMFILRGSGPSGISGMPIIRDNFYIRPLLKLCRKEIIEFLSTNRLDYVTDSSNLDLKHTRNRIRHRLIPTLKRDFNPNIVASLNSLSNVVRCEDECMAEMSQSLFDRALAKKKSNTIILLSNELLKFHPALIRRILRKTILDLKGNLKRIRFQHIDSIRVMLSQNRGYRQLNLPDGIIVEFENEKLKLRISHDNFRGIRKETSKNSFFTFRYSIKEPQCTPFEIYIDELKSHFKFSVINQKVSNLAAIAGQNTVFFDMDRLSFPLIIRNVQPGDRFSPLGMRGTQKLTDFFINTKVPQSRRKYIPIVESKGQIIWIAGYRCSHSTRVRSKTNRILKVEFSLPKTQ